MLRQRRSFTEGYKRQAVELVVSSRRSVPSVAKELGLRDSVLRRWVAAWRLTTQATPISAAQASEIARLRQEKRTAAHGARHFKKLIAIFAGTRT
ncbi:transposase [Bradyrhizobium sp. USDA 4486]